MSTRTVKICEECGKQDGRVDAWLVVSCLEIKLATTDESVVHSDTSLDFCSPGCLLRYVWKPLEKATIHHGPEMQAAERVKTRAA